MHLEPSHMSGSLLSEAPKSLFEDPSTFFPYEIFVNIICFAQVNDPDGPLPLLAISSRWRNLLLETPDVWANIEIDHSEDVVDRTLLSLHLSRGFPIDLRITPPLKLVQHLEPVIKERNRIRTLTLSSPTRGDNPYWPWRHGMSDVLKYLDQKLTYPQLEEIIVDYHDVILPRSFLAACPALQSISGVMVTQSDALSLSNTVTILEYNTGNASDLGVLNERHFKFRSLKLINNYNLWDRPEYVTPLFLERSVPTLQHLSVQTFNLHLFLQDFLRYSPSRLRSLSTRLPTDMIQVFVGSLQFLPVLDTLTLKLVTSSWEDQFWDQSSTKSVHWPLLRYFAVVDETNRVERPCLKKLVHCFSGHETLRAVEKVNLQLRGHIPELLLTAALLNSIPTARLLEIEVVRHYKQQYMEESDIQVEPIVMPNVVELTINRVDCLRVIHAPNVTNLHIKDYSIAPIPLSMVEGFGNQLSRLTIDSCSFEAIDGSYRRLYKTSPWNKVEEIIWILWQAPCELFTASLNSLTTITLVRTYDERPRQNPMNALCFILLGSNHSCPSLHTIRSPNYPLWELLFTFLHYRLHESALQPIKTIQFPYFPVTPILSVLVSLLKGDETRLVGGIDSVIRKRLRNQTITACSECVVAGYVQCYGKPVGNGTEKKTSDDDPTSVPDEPLVSKELLDLVEFELPLPTLTLHTSKEWESALDQELPLNASGYSCSRHKSSRNLVTINSHTPTGEYVQMTSNLNAIINQHSNDRPRATQLLQSYTVP